MGWVGIGRLGRMLMRLLSKVESLGGKCPVCRVGWAQFWDLGNGLFACQRCGCAFVKVGDGVSGGGDNRMMTKDEARAAILAAKSRGGVVAKPVVDDFEAVADPLEVDGPTDAVEVAEAVAVQPEGKTGHICLECGKEFKTKLAMTGHMRSHGKA